MSGEKYKITIVSKFYKQLNNEYEVEDGLTIIDVANTINNYLIELKYNNINECILTLNKSGPYSMNQLLKWNKKLSKDLNLMIENKYNKDGLKLMINKYKINIKLNNNNYNNNFLIDHCEYNTNKISIALNLNGSDKDLLNKIYKNINNNKKNLNINIELNYKISVESIYYKLMYEVPVTHPTFNIYLSDIFDKLKNNHDMAEVIIIYNERESYIFNDFYNKMKDIKIENDTKIRLENLYTELGIESILLNKNINININNKIYNKEYITNNINNNNASNLIDKILIENNIKNKRISYNNQILFIDRDLIYTIYQYIRYNQLNEDNNNNENDNSDYNNTIKFNIVDDDILIDKNKKINITCMTCIPETHKGSALLDTHSNLSSLEVKYKDIINYNPLSSLSLSTVASKLSDEELNIDIFILVAHTENNKIWIKNKSNKEEYVSISPIIESVKKRGAKVLFLLNCSSIYQINDNDMRELEYIFCSRGEIEAKEVAEYIKELFKNVLKSNLFYKNIFESHYKSIKSHSRLPVTLLDCNINRLDKLIIGSNKLIVNNNNKDESINETIIRIVRGFHVIESSSHVLYQNTRVVRMLVTKYYDVYYSNNRDIFQSYYLNKYKNINLISRYNDKKDIKFNKIFTKLSLYNENKKDYLTCNIEDIWRVANEIIKEEERDIKEAKRIVIEGSAGTGKSTLCKYISREQNGIWGDKFKLIILISLPELRAYLKDNNRNNNNNNNNNNKVSINDLIGCLRNNKLNEINKNMLLRNKNKILWILDGFEEVENTEVTVLNKFLKDIEENTIDWIEYCIIGSRRERQAHIIDSVTMKVNRWTNKDVENYIKIFYDNRKNKEEDIKKALNMIKLNKKISDVVRTPLLCELYCIVCNKLNNNSNISDLFQEVIEWMIERYEDKDDKNEINEEYLENKAYETYKNNGTLKININNKEENKLYESGFTKLIYKKKKKYIDVDFIHKTLLEYLLARYFNRFKDKNKFKNEIKENIKINRQDRMLIIFITSIIKDDKDKSKILLNYIIDKFISIYNNKHEEFKLDIEENGNKLLIREEWRIELRLDIIIEMLSILGDEDEMNNILINRIWWNTWKVSKGRDYLHRLIGELSGKFGNIKLLNKLNTYNKEVCMASAIISNNVNIINKLKKEGIEFNLINLCIKTENIEAVELLLDEELNKINNKDELNNIEIGLITSLEMNNEEIFNLIKSKSKFNINNLSDNKKELYYKRLSKIDLLKYNEYYKIKVNEYYNKPDKWNKIKLLFQIIDTVSLWNNKIGDEECKLIMKYLIDSKKFKRLSLWYNDISDKGCEYLIEGLKENKSLTEIYLDYNNISNKLKHEAYDIVKKNKLNKK